MAETLTTKERIAFKIGARARKFLAEGCPIEGYEMLHAALAEAQESDPEMHALLRAELDKLDKKMESFEEQPTQ